MKNSGKFIGIDAEDIRRTLAKTGRQYLVGNLSKPQALEFVRDAEVEIGLTSYDVEAYEKPHWHQSQREYQYVVAGETHYINVASGETLSYCAGDFYAILPELCYEQTSAAGTVILFIKRPAIDDKMLCRNCHRKECSFRKERFSEEKRLPRS